MNTMNMQAFNKNIFKKGNFHQLVVSPYSGEFSSRHNRVIVVSDKVTEVTYGTYRSKAQVLILPFQNSVKETIKLEQHYKEICNFTGVVATFFSVFDLHDKFFNQKLFTISEPRKEAVAK